MTKHLSAMKLNFLSLTGGSFFLPTCLFFFAFPCAGITQLCNAINHGNWSNPAIWDCMAVPQASDEVVITGEIITLDQNGSCLSLTMTSGSLTGATFNFFNNGNFYWQGGTVNVLNFDQADDLFFQTSTTKDFNGGEMTLHDEAYWQNGNVGGGGLFRITDIASINAEHPNDQTFTPKIIVENGGELNKSTFPSTSTFNGQLDFQTGSIFNVNAGTLKINSSTSTFTGASVHIAAGATLEFSAGTHNLFSAAFTGSGKIKLSSGTTLNFNAGCTLPPTLELELTGGTLNDNVGLTWGSATLSSGTYQGTGSPVVSNNLTWSGGTIAGSGTFTVNGSLTMNGNGGKTLTNKTLVAAGGGSWTQGQLAGSVSTPAIIRIPTATTLVINLASATNAQNGIAWEFFGTLTKQANNDCDLDGSSTFNGATVNVEAGTLAMAGGSFESTTVNVSSGAILECDGSTTNFNTGASVAGAGTFKTTGAPTVNFNTGSSLGTALEITGGTLNYVPNLNLSAFTLSGGTFAGSADVTVSGAMNWNNASTISGSGTMTAAGSTNISGTTKTFNSKTLLLTGTAIWSDGSLSGSGILRVAGSGVLNLDFTSNISLSAFGKLDVLGTLNKNQTSTVTLGNEMDLTGATLNVNAGILSVGNSGNVDDYGSSTFNLASGATYKCTGNSTHNFNSGTSVSGAGELEISVGSGSVVTFSAGSSLSCKLKMLTGGGTLTDNAGLTPTQYTHLSGTYNGTGSPVVSGNMTWEGGAIAGSGTFTVSNSLTISGSATNTLSGKTFILGGTGTWTAGNFSVTGNGIFRVGPQAVFTCSLSASKAFSGTAGTRFENEGELSVINSAAPNFSIPFYQINRITGNATLVVPGTLLNEGTGAPGTSPGLLTLQTGIFDNTGGILEIELESDAGDGSGSDLLAITGAATLGGTLNVTLLAGYLPPVGAAFTIMTFASRSGTFTTTNLPINPASWEVEYNATSVVLKVVGALPVELLDFRVFEEKTANLLTWATASEFNTHEFSIERSAAPTPPSGGWGVGWEAIGSLPAAGFSSEEKNYVFSDESPLPKAYYRLKMSDLDGRKEFSPVIFLKRKTAGWTVFPTAFTGWIEVQFEDEDELDLYLADALGRRVWAGRSGAGRLDFGFLPPGNYWLSAVLLGRFFTVQIIRLP